MRSVTRYTVRMYGQITVRTYGTNRQRLCYGPWLFPFSCFTTVSCFSCWADFKNVVKSFQMWVEYVLGKLAHEKMTFLDQDPWLTRQPNSRMTAPGLAVVCISIPWTLYSSWLVQVEIGRFAKSQVCDQRNLDLMKVTCAAEWHFQHIIWMLLRTKIRWQGSGGCTYVPYLVVCNTATSKSI